MCKQNSRFCEYLIYVGRFLRMLSFCLFLSVFLKSKEAFCLIVMTIYNVSRLAFPKKCYGIRLNLWQSVRNNAKKLMISFVCLDNIITFAIELKRNNIIKEHIDMSFISIIGLLSISISILLQNGVGNVVACR